MRVLVDANAIFYYVPLTLGTRDARSARNRTLVSVLRAPLYALSPNPIKRELKATSLSPVIATPQSSRFMGARARVVFIFFMKTSPWVEV